MNLVAAAALVIGTIAAFAVVTPVARRTGLGLVHPAIAWLGLETAFFGIGSAWLALSDERVQPALDVAAALLAFAVGLVTSDALARRRGRREPARADQADRPSLAPGGPPVRPFAVVGLAALGAIVLLPTIASVGLPFLAGDITAARVEIGGLDLQPIRVFLPAAILVAVLALTSRGSRRSATWALTLVVVAIAAELVLASRYLAVELVAILIVGLSLAGRRIATRPAIGIALIGVAIFAGVGVLRAYDQAAGKEVAFAVERTVNRVVLIQPRTLDALQTAIPADQPFLLGLTWIRRLAPALGRTDVPNLGYWIYPRLFPDQAVPGYAAPGLLGEAWANFGWLGSLLFVAVGILAERLGSVVAARRRSLADIAAGSVLIVFLARTHALGVDGFAVLVVLTLGWRLLAAPLDGLDATIRAALSWRPT